MQARQKSVLRLILGSLNRFLSILFIVALGAGFLAGLYATSPDMHEAADRYMDEYRWYDLNVKSALGVTLEDAAAVAALPGVRRAEPAHALDMVLASGGGNALTARVFGMPEGDWAAAPVNAVRVSRGRQPENAGECLVQSTSGGYTSDSPQIGDTLTLSDQNRDMDALKDRTARDSLLVVGIAESPMFISVEPEPSAVGAGSIGLGVYVLDSYFDMPAYTDLFVLAADTEALNTFSSAYDAKIDALTGALSPAASARAALREADVEKAADALAPALLAADALKKDAEARYALISDALDSLRASASPLAGALKSALTDTLRLPAEKKADELPFASLFAALSAADGGWIIRSRADAAGYSSYRSNVQKVAALCRIFPVFFFLVALLVSLTSMTRLVDENRARTGTLKALGFSNAQVLGEYFLYSGLASVLGCALGFSVGFKVFPRVISSAYGMMYTLPAVNMPFRPEIALAVAPATIGGILLATLWACLAQCRATPASLMRAKVPAPGKRILLERVRPLWRRLSFTDKVTCRNLFRYKKRLLMTIVGVAGCSALLVTGFGLRDSIHDIVDRQFGEILKYDLTLIVRDEAAARADAPLAAFLGGGGAVSGNLPYASESGRALSGGAAQSVSLVVPKDAERLSAFVALRDRRTHAAIALDDTGVVMSEKLCEQLSLRVGDTVTLENAAGRRAAARVSGVTENYVIAYVYMTPTLYQAAFGGAPEYSALMCVTKTGGDAAAAALACDSVLYARSSASIKDAFADSVKSIDKIVYVLILAAGILSMVVLYNLTNINVCERKRELATIRVLGFHEKEVERYIFRETNFLSVTGTLLGLLLGRWLHAFVIRTVEIDAAMFGREIAPLSFLYAFLIALLFALLVNRVMRRSISAVNMVESMKANE